MSNKEKEKRHYMLMSEAESDEDALREQEAWEERVAEMEMEAEDRRHGIY